MAAVFSGTMAQLGNAWIDSTTGPLRMSFRTYSASQRTPNPTNSSHGLNAASNTDSPLSKGLLNVTTFTCSGKPGATDFIKWGPGVTVYHGRHGAVQMTSGPSTQVPWRARALGAATIKVVQTQRCGQR